MVPGAAAGSPLRPCTPQRPAPRGNSGAGRIGSPQAVPAARRRAGNAAPGRRPARPSRGKDYGCVPPRYPAPFWVGADVLKVLAGVGFSGIVFAHPTDPAEESEEETASDLNAKEQPDHAQPYVFEQRARAHLRKRNPVAALTELEAALCMIEKRALLPRAAVQARWEQLSASAIAWSLDFLADAAPMHLQCDDDNVGRGEAEEVSNRMDEALEMLCLAEMLTRKEVAVTFGAAEMTTRLFLRALAHAGLGSYYRMRRKPRAALRYLEQAATGHARWVHPIMLLNLSSTLVLVRDFGRALTVLNQAILAARSASGRLCAQSLREVAQAADAAGTAVSAVLRNSQSPSSQAWVQHKDGISSTESSVSRHHNSQILCEEPERRCLPGESLSVDSRSSISGLTASRPGSRAGSRPSSAPRAGSRPSSATRVRGTSLTSAAGKMSPLGEFPYGEILEQDIRGMPDDEDNCGLEAEQRCMASTSATVPPHTAGAPASTSAADTSDVELGSQAAAGGGQSPGPSPNSRGLGTIEVAITQALLAAKVLLWPWPEFLEADSTQPGDECADGGGSGLAASSIRGTQAPRGIAKHAAHLQKAWPFWGRQHRDEEAPGAGLVLRECLILCFLNAAAILTQLCSARVHSSTVLPLLREGLALAIVLFGSKHTLALKLINAFQKLSQQDRERVQEAEDRHARAQSIYYGSRSPKPRDCGRAPFRPVGAPGPSNRLCRVPVPRRGVRTPDARTPCFGLDAAGLEHDGSDGDYGVSSRSSPRPGSAFAVPTEQTPVCGAAARAARAVRGKGDSRTFRDGTDSQRSSRPSSAGSRSRTPSPLLGRTIWFTSQGSSQPGSRSGSRPQSASGSAPASDAWCSGRFFEASAGDMEDCLSSNNGPNTRKFFLQNHGPSMYVGARKLVSELSPVVQRASRRVNQVRRPASSQGSYSAHSGPRRRRTAGSERSDGPPAPRPCQTRPSSRQGAAPEKEAAAVSFREPLLSSAGSPRPDTPSSSDSRGGTPFHHLGAVGMPVEQRPATASRPRPMLRQGNLQPVLGSPKAPAVGPGAFSPVAI